LLENLKKLDDATGQKWSFETDYAAVAKGVEEKGYKDRVGEVLYSYYLTPAVTNILNLMKDDMVKEAFLEAVSKHTIIFVVDKEAPRYVVSELKGSK
jgi:hypothetical protein